MPRYHFHIEDGQPVTDPVAVDFADIDAVRREAVEAAGEMLKVIDGALWNVEGRKWRMQVTDDQHRELFALNFSIDVPADG